MPELVTHITAKKIQVYSDDVICMCIDGEEFYAESCEFEIIPKAINFVLPDGIDIAKLPRLFGRPEEGLRGE